MGHFPHNQREFVKEHSRLAVGASTPSQTRRPGCWHIRGPSQPILYKRLIAILSSGRIPLRTVHNAAAALPEQFARRRHRPPDDVLPAKGASRSLQGHTRPLVSPCLL